MRRARAAGWMVAAALLAATQPVATARAWRWKDMQAAPARTQPLPADATTGVHGDPVVLRVQDRGSHYEVVAENRAPGPVEVELSLKDADNARPVPALPARRVVRAGAETVLARVYPLDPRTGATFDVSLQQVPGDPQALPFDFHYRVPFDNARVRVDQGFGGRYSHADAQNFHAVDFALPEGTPVLAARGGIVLQVESDFQRAGLDRERDGGRANYIRILHDDGSMATYGHLQAEGVQVRVGEQVRQGQPIGRSGNTGFSTAPHLHFVVQANRGMRLEAIPFRMFGPRGELKFAREGTGAAAAPPPAGRADNPPGPPA